MWQRLIGTWLESATRREFRHEAARRWGRMRRARVAGPADGRLAQLAERYVYTVEAAGSSPAPPTRPGVMQAPAR